MGIKNCTKPQLGTRMGFRIDTHVHKNQIFGSDIYDHDYFKKTIYPIIMYNHDSQFFFLTKSQKMPKKLSGLADSFKNLHGSLIFLKYPELMVFLF